MAIDGDLGASDGTEENSEFLPECCGRSGVTDHRAPFSEDDTDRVMRSWHAAQTIGDPFPFQDLREGAEETVEHDQRAAEIPVEVLGI